MVQIEHIQHGVYMGIIFFRHVTIVIILEKNLSVVKFNIREIYVGTALWKIWLKNMLSFPMETVKHSLSLGSKRVFRPVWTEKRE